MQRRSLVLISMGTIIIAGLILSIAFAGRKTALDMNCEMTGKPYQGVIANDKMSPSHIDAERCDTVTIINQDKDLRQIGFGERHEHIAYDGITERLLGDGEEFTITLRKTGTHGFHDHFHEEVAGSFTVR